MGTKCENCELFLILEEERIKWYKELSSKNISLLKKIRDQEDVILILKQKLFEKNSNFLQQHLQNVSQEFQQIQHQLKNLKRSDDLVPLEKSINDKLLEVNKFLSVLQAERERFEKIIEDNEKSYSENMSYVNGLNDYFREVIFTELDKSNKLKKHFIKKMTGIVSVSENVLLDILREENERIHKELKSRYKNTLQKSKEDIERHSQLVVKLRKHNRDLYKIIQNNKMEFENKIRSQEEELEHLKATMKQLKDKNMRLHTQIKLQVEGCQNDILDTRRRMLKLIKPQEIKQT